MGIEHHLQRTQHTRPPHEHSHASSPDGQALSPVDTSYQHIMFLQRMVGNHAVSQLVAQRQLDARTGRIMRQETEPEEPAESAEEAPIQPVAEVQGEVTPSAPDEIDHGRVVHLEGQTTAHFSQSSNSFRSENTRLTRSRSCEGGCSDGDPCVNVATTIVSTYQVPIDVDLPDLSQMDLNDCERQQAQNWIDTVLAPHEQQHVAAFRTYNGTTRRPLNFTCCNSEAQATLDSRAQEMLDSEQASRQSSAQTRSDALDPFNFDFEINCPDEEEEDSGG